jgi:hypothetical protein
VIAKEIEGSSPIGSAEFLYYRNVPNEFAVVFAMLLLFRRGRGDPPSPRLRRGRREFLEARIISERVEHWIELEQRWSERQVRSQWARVRYRE